MTFKLIEERQVNGAVQAAGDARPDRGDEPPCSGTSGSAAVTNGERLRIPSLAYAGVALFVLALTTVNALSDLHDIGPRIAAWKPFVWEYSAAAMVLALLPAIALLTVRTPIGRGRWLRFVLVHLLGTVGFCLVLVGGFIVLRKLVYAALGERYVFGSLSDWIYEYRKDVLIYFAMVAVFVLSARLGARAESAAAPAEPLLAPPAEPDPVFDVRDGARLIRTPVKEIVSARSAGNYVEVHLADGRRPLMRATLATVEAALAPHGFVRTHRSWLVNAKRVRALTPEGSGDWSVELEGGGPAPVSRRFPQALEALRQPA